MLFVVQNFERGTTSRFCPGGRTVSQVFDELKEQNKMLLFEVEDLKQKLKDAYGDMKVKYVWFIY